MSDGRPLAVAWAAGFLDGEGSIQLRRVRPGPTPDTGFDVRITAGQKHRLPLQALLDLFGGSIHRRRDGMFIWDLSGSPRVARALEELVPHLVGKREEAQAVLDYAQTMLDRPNNRPPSEEEAAVRRRAKERFAAARGARLGRLPAWARPPIPIGGAT